MQTESEFIRTTHRTPSLPDSIQLNPTQTQLTRSLVRQGAK